MVDFTIKINGKALEKKYTDIVIYKAVNKIPTAKITLLDGEAAEEDFKESSSGALDPGKPIEILADKKSLFKGVITKHSVRFDSSGSRLVIECKDKVVKLTIERKSNCFKINDKKKESSLFKEQVLKGFVGTIDTFGSNQKQLIQHDCTDWDFSIARAELHGMLVVVKDGKISIKKPKVSKEDHTLKYGEDLLSFKGEIDARYQYKGVKSTGWNYKTQNPQTQTGKEPSVKPPGNLTQKKLADTLQLGTINLQTTGQLEKEELKAWASAQLLKSQMAMTRGIASCDGKIVLPLQTVALAGVGKKFNGKTIVTGVTHQIRKGIWTTTLQFGLSPSWFSQKEEFNGLPAAGLLPAIQGLQIGKVLKTTKKDPDSQDRIFVSIPAIDKKEGIWVRQASFSTGAVFRPKKDDEIILGFLNNDPRQAIMLGMFNHKDAPSPIKMAEDKDNKKIAIYAPHNKDKDIYLEFDQKEKRIELKYKKRILLIDEKNKKIALKDDKSSLTIEDEKVSIKSKKIIIEAEDELTLKGKKTTAKASDKLTLQGKGVELKSSGSGTKIKGAPNTEIEGTNVNIKANAKFSAKGTAGAEITASGITTVKGSLVKIN